MIAVRATTARKKTVESKRACLARRRWLSWLPLLPYTSIWNRRTKLVAMPVPAMKESQKVAFPSTVRLTQSGKGMGGRVKNSPKLTCVN